MSASTPKPQGLKRRRSSSPVEILVPSAVVISTPSSAKKPKKQEPGEEKRIRQFRRQMPKSFEVIWERVTRERFFVLKRERCDLEDCPQEDFELAGSTGNVYKVRIARRPTCNCPYALKGHQCKHPVYILHRVLKAPEHLVYQLALLGSELRDIYDNLPQLGGDGDNEAGNRKEVEGECAICYMDLDANDKSSVVWCRAACGQNFHRFCFGTWAKACAGGTKGVTCPLCRSPWDTQEEDAGAGAAVDTEKGVQGRDGYVNVADQLGISGIRDRSTYHNPYPSWYGTRKRRRRW